MAAVTLTTLRARARVTADKVNSTFVDDTATGLDAFINEGHQILHGKLVDALDEEYVEKEYTFSTVANQVDYALPSDFFKLYGVDMTIGGIPRSLSEYTRPERNAFNFTRASSRQAWWSATIPHYRLTGSNLRILPIPSDVTPCNLLYAPEATLLTLPSDSVNYPNGWERYIVLYAAIRMLAAEEQQNSVLEKALGAIEQEIELTKERRDLASPKQVVDMDRVNFERWY